MQQVTVGHVQFKHTDADTDRAARSFHKGIPDLVEFGAAHGQRQRPALGHRQRGWRQRLPGVIAACGILRGQRAATLFGEGRARRRLAPGMCKLHSRHTTHRLDELNAGA